MSSRTPPPKNDVGLRLSAEERLRDGTAPSSRNWATSGDALACLHQLASNPASAADALKFLHELQVYQVELDLQQEQREQDWAELAAVLARYVELYERVAVGLICIDNDGVITDANPHAALLLHADAEHMSGRRLDSFLSTTGRAALVTVLAGLNAGAEARSCVVSSDKSPDAHKGLRLTATRSRDGRSRLVALMEASPSDSRA